MHLLVAIRMNKLDLDCLVAHAPHSEHNEAVREEWWRGIRRLLQSRADLQVPLVIIIDANARVGSAVSSAIGDYGAQ
eukprot:15392368-Heterocapsa_arctica.AAC.1